VERLEDALERALVNAQAATHTGRWLGFTHVAIQDRDRDRLPLLAALAPGVGERPLSVTVTAVPSSWTGPLPDQGFAVRSTLSADGQAALDIAITGSPSLRYADRLVATLASLRPGAFPELLVRDWPAIPRRGFMECYYGTAWSHEERLWLIEEAGRARLNTYCYGPAADERTGRRWRALYDEAALAQFGELVAAGREHGVDIVWRVSPAAPLDVTAAVRHSDPADQAALADKVRQLAGVGIRLFLIAFDDLSHGLPNAQDRAHFGDDEGGLARAQAALVNGLRATLSRDVDDMHLSVCPSLYWSTAESAYRTSLLADLHPDISVCWTGPNVVSHRITEDEMRCFARQADGREIWLWDNYPVNDWGGSTAPAELGHQESTLLFLGPVEKREPAVAAALGAYFVNGGEQAPVVHPVMLTAASWAWNPDCYRRDAAWQRALDDVAIPLPLVQAFAATSVVSPLRPRDESGLSSLVWSFLGDLDAGADCRAAAADLGERLGGLRVTAQNMCAEDSRLAVAVRPWAAALATAADIAALAVALLSTVVSDDHTRLEDTGRRFRAAAEQASDGTTRIVANGALGALVDRALLVGGTYAPLPEAVRWGTAAGQSD
jgi:hypothetical protein